MSAIKRGLVVLLAMGLCLGSLVTALAADEEFPTKPITLVCPYGAGGSTSMGSRIIAGALGKSCKNR